MKTLLLAISFTFFSFLPLAYSQSYYAQSTSHEAKADHHLDASQLPRAMNNGTDSSYTFLDYYLADSALYAPDYMGLQGQLINSYYNFYGANSDTTNSYKAKSMFFMNYDCINSISVAFDSIVGGSEDTIAATQLDTIYIPLIQVHHSQDTDYDTLEIQLNPVDSHGYPVTNTYFLDTLIIGDTIGAGNDYTINTVKWNLSGYQISGNSRFSVSVTYYDRSKLDSCWFIYGYGYFNRTCPYEGNINTFASNTYFSNITNKTRDFKANSFAQWNEYTGLGYFPTEDGNNVFFPCTAADTDSYHPGVDGANYLQDIDIAADVLFISYLGVPSLHSSTMSVTQNYPNPYNATTVIDYSLIKTADVSLKITDLAGREILSQTYGIMESGQHSITLNANTLSAGVYFYSITASGYTVTKKMVVY